MNIEPSPIYHRQEMYERYKKWVNLRVFIAAELRALDMSIAFWAARSGRLELIVMNYGQKLVVEPVMRITDPGSKLGSEG